MRLLLIRRSQLALLCLILAPWQSFAGWLPVAEFAVAPMAVEHCQQHAQHTRCMSHSACGMSCCAALPSAMASRWTAPRRPGVRTAAQASLPPPTVVLDRLDRPPR